VAESLEFAADMIEFYGTDQERDEAGGCYLHTIAEKIKQ